MSTIEATIRNTKTKGDISSLRIKGSIPAIIYGGSEKNQKISLGKKNIKNLIEKENFLSNIISLSIDGKPESVLPKEIAWDPITDEPIHIDFLRIVKGATVVLEIPVKFINNDKSLGLKRGGVLNIVRRKVELKCPAANIPTELVVDLDNLDIGASIKISSINLPENVFPVIQGRDFVVATIAAPTIIKEPEKPAEETTEEGAEVAAEEGAEVAAEDAEGEEKAAEGEKKEAGKEGEKKEDKKGSAKKK
jgi:large subunit ribosomal protein L25|tara:strand:+ start:42 stop:788 length:747 start_codon:yes stop_codon:yes gene_type:complete